MFVTQRLLFALGCYLRVVKYWTIKLGNNNFKAGILDTPLSRAIGYQHCKDPGAGYDCLLFLFDTESNRTFHMNGVDFDILLFGFDSNGEEIYRTTMEANSNKTYLTPPCKFVVELPKEKCGKFLPEDCSASLKVTS